MPLRALACLTALAAVLTTGCGGGDSTQKPTPAQRLAAPGSAWVRLKPKDQVQALRSCRLDVAVRAAKMGGVHVAPYFSGRYNAVAGVDGDELRKELTAYFRGNRHADETIGTGCSQVLRDELNLNRLAQRSRADFATPVTAVSHALRLNVFGDHVGLQARVSPAHARLDVTPAPGRARSTAHIVVRQNGDRATVALSRIPLGLSYLRVVVRDSGRPWERLLVVRRGPTKKRPTPRTFVPLVISGKGSKGLPILYLPRRAEATVSTQGTPLSLTSGGTVLLAHGLSDRDRHIRIDAGRYRNVQVTATGEWTIRIVPAKNGSD